MWTWKTVHIFLGSRCDVCIYLFLNGSLASTCFSLAEEYVWFSGQSWFHFMILNFFWGKPLDTGLKTGPVKTGVLATRILWLKIHNMQHLQCYWMERRWKLAPVFAFQAPYFQVLSPRRGWEMLPSCWAALQGCSRRLNGRVSAVPCIQGEIFVFMWGGLLSLCLPAGYCRARGEEKLLMYVFLLVWPSHHPCADTFGRLLVV